MKHTAPTLFWQGSTVNINNPEMKNKGQFPSGESQLRVYHEGFVWNLCILPTLLSFPFRTKRYLKEKNGPILT